jgi:hypothetical protein
MSAVIAIRALLIGSAPMTAIVPATRIVAGIVPQGAPLPALSVMHISTVGEGSIDGQSAATLSTSRVQITAMARDYPAVKALLVAARLACNRKSGMIAGVSVASILRDTVGPDFVSDDATIYYQTIDFKVTFHEAN